MDGRKADRQDRDMFKRVVALVFALAVIAERAGAMPAPIRCLALHFLRRAELAAHSYVYWAARDCGAPLQWALPDATSIRFRILYGQWRSISPRFMPPMILACM